VSSLTSVDSPRSSIRRPLTWLTLAKFFVNMALRLAYPFNTDIAKGLGVSLDQVGRVQGVGELTGLVSAGIGHQLDRGLFRRWVVIGVAAAGFGSLALGVGERLWVFGVCFAMVAGGVAVMTTAAQTWIGSTVPYAERGRVIGIYEASWAVALLIGAPVAGVLIDRGSWWWPFAGIGVIVLAIVPFVSAAMSGPSPVFDDGPSNRPPPVTWTRPVLLAIATSSLLTLGAVVVFASYGAFLKEKHGFSTAKISALTLGLGVVELIGSGSIAIFSDRIGKRRSVALGSSLMAVSAVVLMIAGDSTIAAAGAVVVFFGGFEFGYVAQISVNSEVGGAARGRVMAINGGIVTIGRAVGAALGTWLYVRSGMVAVSVVSLACALAAVAAAIVTPDH
jgi:MFS transporter, DHA1 family, inner membrane transport protein